MAVDSAGCGAGADGSVPGPGAGVPAVASPDPTGCGWAGVNGWDGGAWGAGGAACAGWGFPAGFGVAETVGAGVEGCRGASWGVVAGVVTSAEAIVVTSAGRLGEMGGKTISRTSSRRMPVTTLTTKISILSQRLFDPRNAGLAGARSSFSGLNADSSR